MNLVKLETQRPGTTFRVCDIEYRLLYVNSCRAHVEPLARRTMKINKTDDLTGLETPVEFSMPSGRQNIAPGTMVEVLGVDNDDLLGIAPTRAERKTAGHIGRAPQKPPRPLRPGTTRAKMLEYITDDLTGSNKVSDVMAQFNMPRQLVLAHLYEMWNSCGWGYGVDGDNITMTEPLR